VDKHLLEILCCPLTREPLREARRDELDALNRSIAEGGVISIAGTPIGTALSDALITRDRKTIYRIDDGIPVMLVDEGIGTLQLKNFPN
jgi:uncharacterized protein